LTADSAQGAADDAGVRVVAEGAGAEVERSQLGGVADQGEHASVALRQAMTSTTWLACGRGGGGVAG
jgi:hypothetical protein